MQQPLWQIWLLEQSALLWHGAQLVSQQPFWQVMFAGQMPPLPQGTGQIGVQQP